MEIGDALSFFPALLIFVGLYCCFVYFAFTRTEIAVLVAIATVPFFNLVVVHTKFADFRVPFVLWITLLAILVVKKDFTIEVIRRLKKYSYPLAFLSGAYLLSLINSLNPMSTIREFVQILYFSSILIIIIVVMNNKGMLQKVFPIIVGSFSVFVLLGFISFFGHSLPIPHVEINMLSEGISVDCIYTDKGEPLSLMNKPIMRASSCYLGPVGTAGFLLPVLLIAYCQIVFRFYSLKLWQKIFYILFFMVATFLMIITYSRAAWVLSVFLFTMLLIISPRKIGLVLIAFTIAVNVLLLPDREAVILRSAETVNPVKEGSFQGHVTMSQAAWEMFLESPLWGNGAGSFKERLVEKYPNFTQKSDAHNFILQSLAETGLVGFTCLVWFLSSFFWILYRGLRQAVNEFEWASILGFLFAGIGAVLMNLTMNGFMVEFFWVILGLGFAFTKVCTAELNPKEI
ncbi:MAG: O-antigen ligase family protein [Bacillota bacterium]